MRIAIVLILALGAAAVFQGTSTRVPGLRARVNVTRDERDVPYIEAANDHDLYFAQGYVTAKDRLWQMDLFRRQARGELAEILGPSALDGDKSHRRLGFSQVVDGALPGLPAVFHDALQAYADGVNAYMKSLDSATLPAEFQVLQYKPAPWRPADSLLVGKLLSETLSTSYQSDLMRASMGTLADPIRKALLLVTSPLDVILVGTDKREAPRTVPNIGQRSFLQSLAPALSHFDTDWSTDGLQASNNWVVSGKRTVTGKPLLANDPHLAPNVPSIWHMVELSAPGLHVAGVAAPGVPGVLLGHNDRIAWGCTNLGADVQDLYVETFDPANPKRYKTPSGWQEATIRHEEIKVRGAASVTLDVVVTRHGPIILEDAARKYALRWTALDTSDAEFGSFHAINRARNWNEFREALRMFPGPSQNFVYADRDGNIGYYGAGRIPIRAHGDGSLPYDGSNDEGEWRGYIPFDQLPHLYNPPSGAIVTANNRIVGLDYPFHLTDAWADPNRARRIRDLLDAKPKLSADDMRTIQADTVSISGKRFAEEANKLVPGLVPAWDGNSTAESHEAVLVAGLRTALRRRVLAAAGGTALVQNYGWANSFIDRMIADHPPELLPKEFNSYADLLRASFKDAQDDLTRQYGADQSRWVCGTIRPARFTHPLASIPGAGAAFAILPFPQNGSGACGAGATVNVGANVSMRLIADVSNWDHTLQGIALGESGNPSSPHYKDQLDDWRNVSPRMFPFTPAAVRSAGVQAVALEP